MRAIVFDPSCEHGLRFGDAPEPTPAHDEVVVRVEVTSLNFGELAFMDERKAPGFVGGNDAVGVVLDGAANGSGPPVGTRVLGFAGTGGWAERCTLAVDDLAPLPDGVLPVDAATLPAAATTALRAVRGLGSVLGRRVLVTGASGGVGRFAVQLAALAGAEVVAAVGKPERGVGLEALGASQVVVGLDAVRPVFGVIDNVGGPLLAEAYALLERGGLLQAVGVASLEPSELDFEAQRLRVGGTRIEAFGVGTHAFGADLALLAGLVAHRRLSPEVGWRGDWERVHEAVTALRERRVAGKAVLELGG